MARTMVRPSPAPPTGGPLRRAGSARRSARAGRPGSPALGPHPEPRLAADDLRPQRHRLAVAAVADGVLGELDDRLRDSLSIGDDHTATARFDRPGPVGQCPHLLLELVRELAEIDGRELEGVRLLVLRQQEKVIDYARHPVELVGHELEGLAPRFGRRVEELDVTADDRKRRPSSCPASATKRRWPPKARSSRSSIALKVVASCATSSRP